MCKIVATEGLHVSIAARCRGHVHFMCDYESMDLPWEIACCDSAMLFADRCAEESQRTSRVVIENLGKCRAVCKIR